MSKNFTILEWGFVASIIAGAVAGACDKGGDEETQDLCGAVTGMIFSCRGFAEPEGSTDFERCLDRGKKVAKSGKCSELWKDAYRCLAALPCEGFLEWYFSPHDLDPKQDFPCNEEEDIFYTDCEKWPLYSDD